MFIRTIIEEKPNEFVVFPHQNTNIALLLLTARAKGADHQKSDERNFQLTGIFLRKVFFFAFLFARIVFLLDSFAGIFLPPAPSLF
jgi:hypothetical protein